MHDDDDFICLDYVTGPSNGQEPHASIGGGDRDAIADLNNCVTAAPPHLTVIVPTRREERDVASLLDGLRPAVAGLGAEIIFVVDSGEDCPSGLIRSAARCRVPVRLLRSPRSAWWTDRSSAVAAGTRHARGVWVLVMNAGPQHPPEVAATLASVAMRHDADIVIGTRYADGISPPDCPGRMRRMLVAAATWLAKTAFPRRLAMVSDPLSGLFAFRAAAVRDGRLNPLASRMLLEILVRHPSTRVAEVAYPVSPRCTRPRAPLYRGLQFLLDLAGLRLSRLAGQLREKPTTSSERIGQALRFVAFGMVGATGLVVNTGALWFFYDVLGWNHLVGAALATQISTAWNFVLIDALVYRKRADGGRLRRAVSFFAMNNLLLLARLPVLQALVVLGMGVLTANAVTLALLFLIRFVVSDRAIFGSAKHDKTRDPVRILVDLTAPSPADGPASRNGGHAPAGNKRPRYLPYRYDIDGVVTIGSQIVLPELEFFRAQWVADSDVDIAVRVGDVGGRTPRKRAAMTEYAHPAAVRYTEHLGRIGANFRVYLGSPLSVEIGPLLAHSSHVAYTNILEPLLRFVMASRGRMLLHSACVEVNGVGVMLSARTDTGKTGTVLRLLDEHGGRFLSDDMTVIDGHGNASCFPKPLTISAHTLRAVRPDDLTRSEWHRLQLQSRLHSKNGRSFAMALSRFNVPIMGINALTQMIIPPPKYSVDRLVPCRMASSTQVRELFIIERGAERLDDLGRDEALEQLIVNTDDAYGFPPFRYLAPAISIGGRDYQGLRLAERQILAQFLSHLRVRVLASDCFGWAADIPRLIDDDAGLAEGCPELNGRPGPDAWPRWDQGPAESRGRKNVSAATAPGPDRYGAPGADR
jgi:dolichol-phosphate mannosyltransferase